LVATHGGTVAVDELSAEECLHLLNQEKVGRVGISVRALPVILPVNFVMHEGDVIFRVNSGTKLAAATAGAIVAFEVDHYGHQGTSGWSVLLQGRAEEISDPQELAQARSLPLHSWALDGLADHYVRIDTAMMSGRRFQAGDFVHR
jgi:uncharacterized protein